MKLRKWDGLDQNMEDISRKFAGTYVEAIVPEYDTKTPHICNIGEFFDDFVVVHTLTGSVNADWRTVDVINPYPTKLGVFQHENQVYLIQRNGARQWQVGMCSGNTIIRDHDLAAVRRFVNLHMSVIASAFRPKFQTSSIDAASDLVKRTKGSLALSHTYWVKYTKNGVVLFRRDKPLGTFSFGKFFLNKACNDLRQELWDELKLGV